ncbi:MAG: GNAT family N-acetyltransferase [Clostridia bacterium]|nr:GNAT family N-acetyltransferase [Clostridia bacterium]
MIRKAVQSDIPALQSLLRQVLTIHANGRPDVFKHGTTKYTENELSEILENNKTPIFVYVDANDCVHGYVFCQYHSIENNNILQDLHYLYIDDLCVDEAQRGLHIGKQLFEFVKQEAKAHGCSSIRLNVWDLNDSALAFYQKMGFLPLSHKMEYII